MMSLRSRAMRTITNNIFSKPANEPNAELVNEWNTLRSLLLSEEQATIDSIRDDLTALRERINNPEQRIQDISDVLSEATVLSQSSNGDLSSALRPVLEAQFSISARENPELMAEALFPILGPAIRKMIASLFKFDASGSSKIYSIEQLFVIDKETGIPLVHVVHEDAFAQDADMVSGMLSAIQSYVQEAFSTASFDGLNTLELGELSVWIEWGPNAVLASVIRGIAPESFRRSLQERLEIIHQQYSQELRDYDGDSEPFDPLKIELTKFIHNNHTKSIVKLSKLTKKQLVCSCAAMVALIALVTGFIYSEVDENRWQTYISQLKDTPGIIVTGESRGFGQYHIEGLLDPMAVDPIVLLKHSSLQSAEVSYQFEPYHALHSAFIVKRARSMLAPPETTLLTLQGSTLVIEGLVTSEWLKETRRFAPLIAGIESVQYISTLSTRKFSQ